MIQASLFICLGGLLVSLVGEGTDRFILRAMGKSAASFAFVAWALLHGVAGATPHGMAVMVALGLSVIGDLALLSTQRPWFLSGLVAFLLAHVAYVVAFAQLGILAPGALVAAALLAVIAGLVWRWLKPHVGSMKGPVLAYIAVITVMVAFAAGTVAEDGSRWWLLVAAVLFFCSDLFVARQRFVHTTPVNRYVGLPLYYAAQLLFGWAAAAL